MAYVESVEYWHWLIFGLILLIAEVFVFGAVLLWFGLAAIMVGVLVLFFSLASMPSLLIWAGLSLTLVLGWQAWRRRNPPAAAPSTINRRGEQIVGRHFTLTRDIVNGAGELHIDDTRWKITSSHDLAAGTKVKVTSVEGTSLKVEEYIS